MLPDGLAYSEVTGSSLVSETKHGPSATHSIFMNGDF